MGMAAAIAVAALIGAVAAINVGNARSTHLSTVAGRSPEKNFPLAATGAAQTATIIPGQGANPPTAVGGSASAVPVFPAQPTAEDVQRILAGITAEIMAPPASTATTAPLTKAQVEQEVRSKLSQLGINF